jgi:hypothetical protein
MAQTREGPTVEYQRHSLLSVQHIPFAQAGTGLGHPRHGAQVARRPLLALR